MWSTITGRDHYDRAMGTVETIVITESEGAPCFEVPEIRVGNTVVEAD